MSWTVRLEKAAARQLSELPPDHQDFLRKHLREMAGDPFRGNVKPLKEKQWKGRYRKRAGRYRLIFIPFYSERIVEVSAILLRSEKTYR